MATFFPVHRDVARSRAGASTPLDDMVSKILTAKKGRDEQERLKRLEERQARLDQMAAEERARQMQMEDFEMQKQLAMLEKTPEMLKASAEAQSMATEAPPESPTAKAVTETGPDGKKKTQFEGPAEEVLEQMKLGFKGRKRPLDEPTELIAPEILQPLPSPAAMPAMPEGLPPEVPLTPTEAPPLLAPGQEMPERRTADLSLFGAGEAEPVPMREEMLDMMREQAMAQPNVIAAMANVSKRKSLGDEMKLAQWKEAMRAKYRKNPGDRWEIKGNPEDGIYRINPEDGTVETLLDPMGPSEKARPKASDKILNEFADMNAMAERALDLTGLPNDYKMEMADWVPNIIRNFMSEELEGKEDGFFTKYQAYEPAYFMFTAEMLKAVQGSRPSDKDMEWYLQNMPRLKDNDFTKATKIHRLLSQLAQKYNSKYDVFAPVRDIGHIARMEVPSREEIEAMLPSSTREPVTAGNIKSIQRID